MADMEALCARLCLLTRAVWREDLPSPLSRATVRRMLRLGALEGLDLCRIPEVKEEYYARAEALLSRSSEIGELVDHWRVSGYDALLPERDDRLINLQGLGIHAPLFVFACGNRKLLSRKCVAVAGSRKIEEWTARNAYLLGQHMAESGYVMVCGGASGVDAQAQRGLLEHGGSLILVPALPVKRLMKQEYLVRALAEGRLLVLCDTWPDEDFSPGKALTRNLSIYALGDAAIAVAARDGKGGTWSGATACLRNGCTPLFTCDETGRDFEGNRRLLELGAKPFDVRQSLREQLFGSEVDWLCRL